MKCPICYSEKFDQKNICNDCGFYSNGNNLEEKRVSHNPKNSNEMVTFIEKDMVLDISPSEPFDWAILSFDRLNNRIRILPINKNLPELNAARVKRDSEGMYKLRYKGFTYAFDIEILEGERMAVYREDNAYVFNLDGQSHCDVLNNVEWERYTIEMASSLEQKRSAEKTVVTLYKDCRIGFPRALLNKWDFVGSEICVCLDAENKSILLNSRKTKFLEIPISIDESRSKASLSLNKILKPNSFLESNTQLPYKLEGSELVLSLDVPELEVHWGSLTQLFSDEIEGVDEKLSIETSAKNVVKEDKYFHLINQMILPEQIHVILYQALWHLERKHYNSAFLLLKEGFKEINRYINQERNLLGNNLLQVLLYTQLRECFPEVENLGQINIDMLLQESGCYSREDVIALYISFLLSLKIGLEFPKIVSVVLDKIEAKDPEESEGSDDDSIDNFSSFDSNRDGERWS